MAETEDFCFEEGLPSPCRRRPAHVLQYQPCFHCKDDDELNLNLNYTKHQHRHDFRPSPPQAATAVDLEPIFHQLKLIKSATSRLQKSSRRYQLMPPPSSNNNVFGGPGMQAVFLDSPQRSCGTGVFLPRISAAGTNHSYTFTKPACPPVLLPSRVVQALNLNVHNISFPAKGGRIPTDKSKRAEPVKQYKNKKKRDESSPQNYSPEIFLPKEWTY